MPDLDMYGNIMPSQRTTPYRHELASTLFLTSPVTPQFYDYPDYARPSARRHR